MNIFTWALFVLGQNKLAQKVKFSPICTRNLMWVCESECVSAVECASECLSESPRLSVCVLELAHGRGGRDRKEGGRRLICPWERERKKSLRLRCLCLFSIWCRRTSSRPNRSCVSPRRGFCVRIIAEVSRYQVAIGCPSSSSSWPLFRTLQWLTTLKFWLILSVASICRCSTPRLPTWWCTLTATTSRPTWYVYCCWLSLKFSAKSASEKLYNQYSVQLQSSRGQCIMSSGSLILTRWLYRRLDNAVHI